MRLKRLGDKEMSNVGDRLSKSSKAFWSSKYEKSLTREEITEISDNLAGFFSVLKEWDDKEGKPEKKGKEN